MCITVSFPTFAPMYHLIVVGGGAAGFFAAIHAAKAVAHGGGRARVLILEQGRRPLQKVRISGGGRCNVTHAEFDPRELAAHYPRGRRELLGPFHRFGPGDTMAWFAERGVETKIEADGRVFPVTDDSQSIIDCLRREATALGVELALSSKVVGVERRATGFAVRRKDGTEALSQNLLLATGSAPQTYRWLAELEAPVVPPVPSLFSFNIADAALHRRQGLSVTAARVTLEGFDAETRGSLLVTHWGLSGPAVLKMSALAALHLHAADYVTTVRISWTGGAVAEVRDYLTEARRAAGGTTLSRALGLPLPRRLWALLVERSGVPATARWGDLNATDLDAIVTAVANDAYAVRGQTRFKDEFVTAGGLDLKALDFRTFGVRGEPGLYAAGEVLNVDGVTGGFNFQAAWTGGYLAGEAIGARILKTASQRLT